MKFNFSIETIVVMYKRTHVKAVGLGGGGGLGLKQDCKLSTLT